MIEDSSSINNELGPVVSFRPSSGWDQTSGHFLFPSLAILQQTTRAFYGIFEDKADVLTEQVLFQLRNEATGNSLTITTRGAIVYYNLKFNGVESIIYETGKNPGVPIYLVGINMQLFARTFGRNVSAFFGNPSQLKVFVGGTGDAATTFAGDIHKIGFCTERNLQPISGWFDSSGVMSNYQEVFDEFFDYPIVDAGSEYFGNDGGFWAEVFDGGDPFTYPTTGIRNYIASYTLLPQLHFGELVLDIATDSYWEDYVPLTYFAQFVRDARGGSFYDLDFIQYNIDYPVPIKTLAGYNTVGALVKTYVSFQYLESGANANRRFFTNTEPVPANGVVEPGDNWLNTRYEVIDGTIIYPPAGISFQRLAIVNHIEMKATKIARQPIRIRSLQMASQAFNEYSSNPIGTRFGNQVFPYKKAGFYFDYKSRNPFKIYKGSSPYLYLTKNSGIEQVGSLDSAADRGLSIPINQTQADDYKVIAMQMSIRFNQDNFPAQDTQIFEIQGRTSFIKFFMRSIHPEGKRARIYAINAVTGQLENGVVFYLNGRIVKDAVINVNEWAMLGLGFAASLDMSNTQGAVRINGPILVNNVTHYESTNLQEIQNVSIRPWFKVLESDGLALDWQFWLAAYLWQGVLVLSANEFYGVDPTDIYKTYTGTNKFIVEDDSQLNFGDYSYKAYKDISWRTETVRPV